MKVLQLGPYPPPHGGVQSNLVAIRNFLRSQGAECAVINITRHRKQEGDDVYYPSSAAGLIQLLWRLQYDVIHLHLGGRLTNRLLGLALVCAAQRRSKSVLTFHSGGYPSTPAAQSTGPNSFAGFVLRRFDGLIGVNAEILGFFDRLGVARQRLRLILPHSFLPEAGPAPTLPPEMNSFFAAHSHVLISVGCMEPEYDLPLQIAAMEPVRRKFADAGLVLVGSGSLDSEIRTEVAASPCAEHIMLCGDVTHSITLRAIARANLMLRTTLYDGDAVSVREALHVGTPVIASDNKMRPTGVHLIPMQNLPALVQAIETQLSQPATAKPGYVSDDSNLRAVLDFYLELTGGKR